MPKEIIENASKDDREFHVEVRWSRVHGAEDVQVATVREREDYAETGTGTGIFVNLNRASINRLIRVLRRARDQAFGADA